MIFPLVLCFIFNVNFGVLCEKFFLDPICGPPRGETCLSIRQCPHFVDLLQRTSIPRPHHVIKEIRTQQCGFYNREPMVCCPTNVGTSNAKIINVRKIHPNLKLLPQENCGSTSMTMRITSGKRTSIGEFPWMALIAYDTEEGIDFKCGGSLINDRYVLTAAHCILDTTIGVRLGEFNINTIEDCEGSSCAPPVQDFYIDTVIIHPNFDKKNLHNDIALLRLSTKVNMTYDNVQPICLPTSDEELSELENKMLTVTGWGITEKGHKSSELLKVTIPVVPLKKCQEIYRDHAEIVASQICAGGFSGEDSCGGDSGGPLASVETVDGRSRYVQHGIVSYGPRQCGSKGHPGIYTKVDGFMEWILDTVKA